MNKHAIDNSFDKWIDAIDNMNFVLYDKINIHTHMSIKYDGENNRVDSDKVNGYFSYY